MREINTFLPFWEGFSVVTIKPEAIRHGELQIAYARLYEKGVLVKGEKGLSNKGPTWKAPQFVIEKRYAE
jgi:hypothetical protein